MNRIKTYKLCIAVLTIILMLIIAINVISTFIRFINAQHYLFHIDDKSMQVDASFVQKIIDGEINNDVDLRYSLPFDKLNRHEVEKLIEYMTDNDLKIIGTSGYRTSQIYLVDYTDCVHMISFFAFAPISNP